jgi:hypothetical protein
MSVGLQPTTVEPPREIRHPDLPEARYVVLPAGIVGSGFPAARNTCLELGMPFQSWQAGAARFILAKRLDGLYAADIVVMSVGRQVGKTYLIGGLVFADSIICPGTLTVWTAHQFKVARETFDILSAIAKSPALLPHIDPDQVHSASGAEEINFRNDSRIIFRARERGSIRGVAKVRRIILDEGQIMSQSAMDDIAPTQNQAWNPQLIMMGTPPKPKDPSEIFTNFRADAIKGKSDDVLYLELSADEDAELDDVEQWKIANPTVGIFTPLRAMRRLRRLLDDDGFRREGLGIWDGVEGNAVIDKITWKAIADVNATAVGEVAYGIDVSPDRLHASISMAGDTADGRLLIEFVEGRNSPDWIVPVAKRINEAQTPRCFVVDGASPAAYLAEPLIEAEVPTVVTTGREYGNACGKLYDRAYDGTLCHLDQPSLNLALVRASMRDIGSEGLWGWNRRKAESNITPIVSATLAVHGLTAEVKNGPRQLSQLYAF